MYVVDYVGESFKRWTQGESVFISAPTGTGKTTFVLESLVENAKAEGREVLFLSNRYLLKEQIKTKIAKNQHIPIDDLKWLESVEEFDGITIVSYQKIQELIENKLAYKYDDVKRYKYVVFDEVHYILEDSTFNPKIIFLLKYIENTTSIKVFMSATIDEAAQYLTQTGVIGEIVKNSRMTVNEILSYELRNTLTYQAIGMRSYVWYYRIPDVKRNLSVYYFDDYNQIISQINESEEKWLVFLSNKIEIKKWSEKLKCDYEVIHSDQKEEELLRQILHEEKFQNQVLITTKLLDNGVNFHDSELKNLVIDTISKTEFLQMLGRKRFQPGEKICVYIPKKSLKYFSGYYSLGIKKIQNVLTGDGKLIKKMLESPETYEIVRKFYIFRNGALQVNMAGKYKIEKISNFLLDMCENMKKDEWAFVKKQLAWLNMEEEFSEQNSLRRCYDEKIYLEIYDLIKQWEGQLMDKEEQKNFRHLMGTFFKNCSLQRIKIFRGKKLLVSF